RQLQGGQRDAYRVEAAGCGRLEWLKSANFRQYLSIRTLERKRSKTSPNSDCLAGCHWMPTRLHYSCTVATVQRRLPIRANLHSCKSAHLCCLSDTLPMDRYDRRGLCWPFAESLASAVEGGHYLHWH